MQPFDQVYVDFSNQSISAGPQQRGWNKRRGIPGLEWIYELNFQVTLNNYVLRSLHEAISERQAS